MKQGKSNSGIRWKLKTYYERARYGISVEDTWNFDIYLSEIISKGCRSIYFDMIEQGNINRMCDLFERYGAEATKRGNFITMNEKEYKEMFKLFKEYFPYMWD